MDFNKLKAMITGIPESEQEQQALRQQNEKSISASIDPNEPGIAPEEAARRQQIIDMGMNSANMAGSIGTGGAQMFSKLREMLSKGVPQEGAIGKGLQEMAGQMKGNQLAKINDKVRANLQQKAIDKSIAEADSIGAQLGLGKKGPPIDKAALMEKIQGANTDDAVQAARARMLESVKNKKALSTEEPTAITDTLPEAFAEFLKKNAKK